MWEKLSHNFTPNIFKVAENFLKFRDITFDGINKVFYPLNSEITRKEIISFPLYIIEKKENMNLKSLICYVALGILLMSSGIVASCDSFNEDLPECRLSVKFKYDYNMEFADAFHAQVDKVELYVFDKNGKYLFKQAEEGSALSTGNYLMEVELPVGQYQFMAWAGARDSYDITSLTPGVSTLTDLKLKLKREASLIINKRMETLWYGEVINVNFDGTVHQTETINLIRDTKIVRFGFQSYTGSWTLDMNDYDYEIIESNGHLGHDNSLLDDDVLSFRPYYMEQKDPATAYVDMNTMRLMEDRKTRLVLTEKASGKRVFDINLIDYLAMTNAEGKNLSTQEYLDRQSNYHIIFFLSESWLAVQIVVNGWVHRIQEENQ